MTTQRSRPPHNCMHLMLLIVHLHLVHTHIFLLLLIGVHSLLVDWLCTCNWCCQLCTHHFSLLIAHTPHFLLLLIVHKHTNFLLLLFLYTELIDWVCALFVVNCETLLIFFVGRRKSKAFYCICEVHSIGIVHIRTSLLVIIYIYI